MHEVHSHDLPERIRVLRALRTMVMEDDLALARSRTSGSLTARAAFDERLRLGALRSDDRRLTAEIRRQALSAHPSLAGRAERLLMLVDEVIALEQEAVAGDDPAMRRAMARQAEAEMIAEADALGTAIAASVAIPEPVAAAGGPSRHLNLVL